MADTKYWKKSTPNLSNLAVPFTKLLRLAFPLHTPEKKEPRMEGYKQEKVLAKSEEECYCPHEVYHSLPLIRAQCYKIKKDEKCFLNNIEISSST